MLKLQVTLLFLNVLSPTPRLGVFYEKHAHQLLFIFSVTQKRGLHDEIASTWQPHRRVASGDVHLPQSAQDVVSEKFLLSFYI